MNENSTPEPGDEMVSLGTLPGIIYAEMVKEALDNQGIPSIIKSDMLSSGLQAKSAGISDDACQIWVYQKHYKKAKNILEGMMDHI